MKVFLADFGESNVDFLVFIMLFMRLWFEHQPQMMIRIAKADHEYVGEGAVAGDGEDECMSFSVSMLRRSCQIL